MKLILLFALVAFVAAEPCDHDSDCTITQCGTNFRIDCLKIDQDHADDIKECTCVPTHDHQTGQTGAVACQGADVTACVTAHGDCHARDHTWHCVDAKCTCYSHGPFGH